MARNQLSILTYHAIDQCQSIISLAPEKFRWQMETLAERNVTGVSLAAAFEHMNQTGLFPDRSVVLTFDDGFLSVFKQALPIMSALGFTGTAFIPTDFIGLSASQAKMRNADLDRDLMDWRHVVKLRESGFEIGAHSMSHADLTRIPSVKTEQELAAGKQCLERRIGQPVLSFAYPYGYYNKEVRNAVARHYRHACTTELGHNYRTLDALLLKRLDVFFLRHKHTFITACEGGLGNWWKFRQTLRNFKAYLR